MVRNHLQTVTTKNLICNNPPPHASQCPFHISLNVGKFYASMHPLRITKTKILSSSQYWWKLIEQVERCERENHAALNATPNTPQLMRRSQLLLHRHQQNHVTQERASSSRIGLNPEQFKPKSNLRSETTKHSSLHSRDTLDHGVFRTQKDTTLLRISL